MEKITFTFVFLLGYDIPELDVWLYYSLQKLYNCQSTFKSIRKKHDKEIIVIARSLKLLKIKCSLKAKTASYRVYQIFQKGKTNTKTN